MNFTWTGLYLGEENLGETPLGQLGRSDGGITEAVEPVQHFGFQVVACLSWCQVGHLFILC